jgi:large subunit ribosomal protein L10
MPLNLEDKKALVAEVNAVAAKALSVVGAENRGLTVGQMTTLRAKARKEGVYMRVVKNTLARKAVAGTPYECISPALKGPLVLAFSKDDPGAAARVVKAFAKDHEKLVTTLVSLGGQLLGPKEIEKVASLPTLQQARAQLLGLMKAPVSKLVRTIAEPHAQLVRVLAAYKAQKEAAG